MQSSRSFAREINPIPVNTRSSRAFGDYQELKNF